MICMVELGELEARHQDFDDRRLRILAVSMDDLTHTEKTQKKFPHLLLASDPEQKMARDFASIHPHMGPGASDTNAPTTFLVDGSGKLRWYFRPATFFQRLSPDELLSAIDRELAK